MNWKNKKGLALECKTREDFIEMSNIISHPKLRRQAPTLTIVLKGSLAEKIKAITEVEGVDPEGWSILQVARGINENWDWEKGKPKHNSETLS